MERSMMRACRLACASLVWVLLATAGCGVGEPSTQTFTFTGIGPEGGHVLVGDILLVIPPGALAADTAVDVAPQSAPLPITKPGNDPCTYAFLGPIWCCGPVGQDLNVPAFVRIAYDEALIPVGRTEADLVLLIWDDAAQTMRPVTQGVIHNVAANYFETSTFAELGHLAVGVRTCLGPARPIVFAGGQVIPIVRPSGKGPLAPGLWLVTPDGSLEPEQLATEGEIPDTFLPDPNGGRIVYEVFLPSEDHVVRTVAPGDAAPTTVVDESRNINGSDPLVGWYRDATNVFFFEFIAGATSPGGGALVGGSVSSMALSKVLGDGSQPPEPLYFFPPFTSSFPTDMRQSSDGSRILIRVIQFSPEFVESIHVVDATDGSLVSAGVIPIGGGHSTPRFVPGSTDVYLVRSDQRAVERYSDAGELLDTIYQLESEDFTLLADFVLAPGESDGYAAVIQPQLALTKTASGGVVPAVVDGQDTLEVGTLSGGIAGATALGHVGAFVDEMIFHPNGQHVILDMQDVRVFSAADAVQESTLPVQSMSYVDVNRDDGRLLILVGGRGQQTDKAGTMTVGTMTSGTVTSGTTVAGGLPNGLYVAAETGLDLTPVDTGGLTPFDARWLTGIRTAPGMFDPGVR
jgi:hypothetical protein